MMTWPPEAWLEAATNPPYMGGPWFSAEKAARAIKFVRTHCTHNKGEWDKHPFRLLPWQYLVLAKLFGWLKENGYRLYRICYIEIPKKNGKSEFAAAVALYLFLADQEPGAEVYSAAADRDQASLVYGEAAKMVRAKKALKRRVKIIDSTKRMVRHSTGSFYRVLSSDVKTKHGLSPHGVIFDELHAQPNRHLWDVLVEGTNIARRQQVVLVLTTAGIADKNSIAWQVHDKARKVKAGVIEDPTFLPILYSAEPPQETEQPEEKLVEDQVQPLWWEDEATWARVNPSLGFIFGMENLREHCREAKQDPVRINNFLRYRLNVWVAQFMRYLPMDHWNACGRVVDPDLLLGRRCWGGVDLSSTLDLTAYVLVFDPLNDGVVPIKAWFWIPEMNMAEREKRDNVSYSLWRKQGHLITTPGNVVDYSFIRRQVNQSKEIYDIQEIGYDPWHATQLAQELQDEDGMVMIPVRQGYQTLSAPTKKLLELTVQHKLAHGGHPVLTWCADNLAVTTDAAECVKPAKDKSTNRIDGIVAEVNALSRWILHHDTGSVYEKRGLLVL